MMTNEDVLAAAEALPESLPTSQELLTLCKRLLHIIKVLSTESSPPPARTSESLSLQCVSNALTKLWKMLGAKNQTEAVEMIKNLRFALEPLVVIAYRYDDDFLDKARPEWKSQADPARVVLYTGRCGANLLTLQHCFDARKCIRSLTRP